MYPGYRFRQTYILLKNVEKKEVKNYLFRSKNH